MKFLIGALLASSLVYATLACRGSGYAAPAGAYGPTATANTAIFGSTGHRQSYQAVPTGDTQICCEAMGFSGTSKRFFNIGCGTNMNGGARGRVEWGNNIANPQIRCRGVPLGSTYTISC